MTKEASMVSSIGGASPVSPQVNTQQVIEQKRAEERRQQEDTNIQRQQEAQQQQIRAEEVRKDADARAGRTIDVIV